MDDGNGTINFEDFCLILRDYARQSDPEAVFRNAFRAFYLDEQGWLYQNLILCFV